MARKQNPLLWIIGGVLVLSFLGFLPAIQIGDSTIGGGELFAVTDTSADEVAPSKQLLSDSITLLATQKYSESPTASNGGDIELFAVGVDPKSPSAVVSHTLKLGVAYTTNDVACGKTYRVVYSNSTSAYAEDLGDQVLIDCDAEYNENTGDSLVDMTEKFGLKPSAVASLSDIFDETSTTGIMNGVTANVSNHDGAREIGTSALVPVADSTILYDESAGDGTFFIDVSYSAGGSNAELKDSVVCFEHESGAEPEANEITDMVVSHRDGQVLPFASGTNWENTWANEECVSAGTMQSGESSTYRFTITYSEANLDANDDWTLVFDDLGDNKGKDAKLNVGATQDSVDFDAQA